MNQKKVSKICKKAMKTLRDMDEIKLKNIMLAMAENAMELPDDVMQSEVTTKKAQNLSHN